MKAKLCVTMIIIVVTLVSGCTPKDIDDMQLVVTMTPDESLVLTMTNMPTKTVTPSVTNTWPPIPTETATVTRTATRTSTTVPTKTVSPCHQAEFIRDITIPDDMEVVVGSSFEKTWRIKNTGSCAWTDEYYVVRTGGHPLGAPAVSPLVDSEGLVLSNNETNVSIKMTAPDAAGVYTGWYKLQSPQEDIFFGENELSGMIVRIKAVYPTATVTAPPTNTPYPTMTPYPTNTYFPTSTPVIKPDLRIVSMNIEPPNPTIGQPVQVSVRFVNAGTSSAGALKVRWWSDSNNATADCEWDVSSVNTGEEFLRGCNYAGYASAGTPTVSVIVDADNLVDEIDENNNSSSMNIEVLP